MGACGPNGYMSILQRAVIRGTIPAILLGTMLFPGVTVADFGEIQHSPIPPTLRKCRNNMWGCTLPTELENTERFLSRRKQGLPYTPDPRPLTPAGEVLRLNTLSQAMGYLSMYRANRMMYYRREAQQRVEYILSLGQSGYGSGVRTGIFGYMFLDAYRLLNDSRYLREGLRIADDCANLPASDMHMNGGLMCAINLDSAYQLTGDTRYRDAARDTVQRTAPKQFADGAFPHLPTQAGGENLSYTAWMDVEMILMQQFDPSDPNLELLMVRTGRFLSDRIAADGSLNYFDANGSYDQDAGSVSRYGVADIASTALGAYSIGNRSAAEKALTFLFRQRLSGPDLGGYPDKYAELDPNNPWLNGNPSVLRTSLIFWYLSLFQNFPTSCSVAQKSCTVTPANCNPAYAELGLCNQSLPGTQTCLLGRWTSCFDPVQTAYRTQQDCNVETYCSDENGQACFYNCTHLGTKRCVGSQCSQTCYDVDDQIQGPPQCDVRCYENNSCSLVTQEQPSPTMCVQRLPTGYFD